MNSKNLRLTLLLTLVGFSSYVFAQDAATEEKNEPTFSLSGSIDTYVRTALGDENPYGATPWAPSTSFSNLKGFSLGMVNLVASYSGEKAGFVADVVFGPRGQEAVFGTVTGQAVINQMYGFLKLSDAVTLNMGQFNTFLGYEVISPAVNFNYSTSYMFSYGPFNHTGLRADFAFGDGMVAKLAVMNPTDMVEFNFVNTYTLGAQIGKTSDAGGVWLNFLYGDQDGTIDEVDLNGDGFSAGKLFQADLTGGYNLSETFYLGFNTSYQTVGEGETDAGDAGNDATSFLGFAVYPKITVSESFAIGARAEYFSITKGHLQIFGTDEQGIDVDGNPVEIGDGNVIALTFSGNYKVGGLTLIPEIRFDKTSEDSFFDKDGEPKDSMISLALAAVYKF